MEYINQLKEYIFLKNLLKVSCLLGFVFMANNITAQDITLDSLHAMINIERAEKYYPITTEQLLLIKSKHEHIIKNKSLAVRFLVAKNLCEHYKYRNLDSALYYNNIMSSSLDFGDNHLSIFNTLQFRGQIYMGMNVDADTIIRVYEILDSFNIKRGFPSHKTYIAIDLGEVYEFRLDNLGKALNSYKEALKVARRYDDDSAYIQMCLLRIARIYRKQKEYKLQKQYAQDLLDIMYKDPNRNKTIFGNSIAAEIHLELGQLDSTIVYYEQAVLIYYKENKIGLELAWTLNKLGKAYRLNGNYAIAEKHLKEAYKQAKGFEYRFEVSRELAELSLVQKKYNQTISIAGNELNELLQRNSKKNYNSLKLAFYKVLKTAYTKTGEYKLALDATNNYHRINDIIEQLNNKKQLKQIALQAQVEQKEQENEILKLEKAEQANISWQRTILGVSALLFAILMTIIAIIQKRAKDYKNKQNKLLEQKVSERTKELLQASEELAKVKNSQLLEEAKTRFFANVSHEFRTPLTLIQGPLTTVLDNNELGNKDKNMLQRALNNSRQLQKLVGQILDLTKFDSGQLTMNKDATIFYLFVRRMIANFETLAQSKNIQLSFEYLSQAQLQLEIDKEKLEQIINNYVSNAIKFTPKNGNISIVIEDLGNTMQIAVADTGIGISKEELKAVFNRFYQVKHKNDDAPLGQVNHYAGGTGIGLSLCKEYATMMNGKAWAESPSKDGNGSIFYFEFPKKEIIQSLRENVINAINIETEITKKESTFLTANLANNINAKTAANTILIVEDNYDLRDFVATLLVDKYRILTAEHGQDALDQLSNMDELPSLIISDVMMPILDGFQLIEALKSSDAFRHIPVMMLTARVEIQDKINALRIGVDDYMLKPFENEELTVRVDNLVTNFNNRKVIQETEGESIQILKSQAIKATKNSRTVKEDKWLKELETYVQESITDFDFNSDKLAEQLLISRSKLFRLTKKITGLTVNEYIKEVRLQTARNLIESGKAESTKEAAYIVGYKNIDYFAQSYKKRFGMRPSEVLYES